MTKFVPKEVLGDSTFVAVYDPESGDTGYVRMGDLVSKSESTVTATTSPGGGIAIPVGNAGLFLPAALRQGINQPWPAQRPAYDGPIMLIGWSDPPAWVGAEYDQFVKIPRIYAPIIETFGSFELGPPPAGACDQFWAAAYTGIEVADHPLSADGRVLKFTAPNNTGRSIIILGSSSDESDQEVLVRCVRPIPTNLNANALGVVVRAGKSGINRSGYLLNIRSTTPAEITISKFENNTGGTLQTLVLTPELSTALKNPTAVAWMRFRAVGSELVGSVWMDGQPESSAAVITATDSGVVSGYAALSSATAGYIGFVDYMSIAYGGNVAPGA